MDEEQAKARAREAVALLTAARQDGASVTETAIGDFGRHMTEATRLLADLPPGDDALKERFLLLLDAMQDASASIFAPLAGLVGVNNLLLQWLSRTTGKSESELMQELALFLA
jgi:hypothetical protein